MDATVQSQLDRVETALNTLADSIASYNPSTTAAKDLLAAETEFKDGIEKLTKHQQNHARLVALRSTASKLSSSLMSSLKLLAETRSQILATSAPDLRAASTLARRAVPHVELLAVASNAARYAAPLSYSPPMGAGREVAPTNGAGDGSHIDRQGMQAQTDSSQPAPTQDSILPDASISQQPPQALPAGQEPGGSFATQTATSNPGLSMLEDSEKHWLDPVTQTPYFPWPTDDMIARSGLARVQGWIGAAPVEEEQQPGQGPPHEEEKVDGSGAMEGMETANGAGSQARIENVARPQGAVQREEKPSQFMGLDLYDPEDD
jgi:hypothetical protein